MVLTMPSSVAMSTDNLPPTRSLSIGRCVPNATWPRTVARVRGADSQLQGGEFKAADVGSGSIPAGQDPPIDRPHSSRISPSTWMIHPTEPIHAGSTGGFMLAAIDPRHAVEKTKKPQAPSTWGPARSRFRNRPPQNGMSSSMSSNPVAALGAGRGEGAGAAARGAGRAAGSRL